MDVRVAEVVKTGEAQDGKPLTPGTYFFLEFAGRDFHCGFKASDECGRKEQIVCLTIQLEQQLDKEFPDFDEKYSAVMHGSSLGNTKNLVNTEQIALSMASVCVQICEAVRAAIAANTDSPVLTNEEAIELAQQYERICMLLYH